MKQVNYYQTDTGRKPCKEWLSSLDLTAAARVDAYIQRVASGGALKSVKPVGMGVFEIKINFGPGYRVYFGVVGNTMILLLCGGDKGSQFRDIRQAQEFWRSYVSK